MSPLSDEILKSAQEEAIYNIYLYLCDKTTPTPFDSLESVIQDLETSLETHESDWNERDIYRLKLLRKAISNNDLLAHSKINNLTRINGGLTACTFTKANGNTSACFRGTGSGEWLDNGQGLSGIPEENTYITYDSGGYKLFSEIRQTDYATDQQVEALNWFRRIVAKNSRNKQMQITVSGHSKGGNKAQFIAINSDAVTDCYSFSGQGFSPEALAAFKKEYGAKYESRRQHIRSFSAENDYVNVLGERLVPENNVYYFKSFSGIHYLEAILDNSGNFRSAVEQGNLSAYVEKVSRELMGLNSNIRQYVTRGVMNVFQIYLGDGTSLNGDTVSTEETIAGIGIAIKTLLRQL